MILRLLHKLRLVELVWLKSHTDDYWYLTIKRKHPDGKYWARVYPFTGTGYVILEEDGTCSGSSFFIKQWLPFKKHK